MLYIRICIYFGKEENKVLISVIYNENGNCGTVHSSRLETLIKSGQIFAFRHPREWIIVGTDKVICGEGAVFANPVANKDNYLSCG